MNGIREELESLREASQTQRKRFLDMILVLLRDVGDIGSIMGGQMNDQKKPTIDNLDQAEEEFTLARLYLSKLKTEARTITGVSTFNYQVFPRNYLDQQKNLWVQSPYPPPGINSAKIVSKGSIKSVPPSRDKFDHFPPL